jgi:hypothetical protein
MTPAKKAAVNQPPGIVGGGSVLALTRRDFAVNSAEKLVNLLFRSCPKPGVNPAGGHAARC